MVNFVSPYSSTNFSGAVHRAFAGVQGALDGLGLRPSRHDVLAGTAEAGSESRPQSGTDCDVLVACSGGADSLALAVAVAQAAKCVGRSTRKKGYPIRAGAVIIDHKLHPDSAAVAAAAAKTCEQLGLAPVIVKTVDVDLTTGDGLEAAARAARYQALDQVLAETGAKAVLLGHTMDDQAESVLLGLARGSGARSLAGIPANRNQYLRPFLGVRRRTTEEICGIFGLTPWDDPTNALAGSDAANGGSYVVSRPDLRSASTTYEGPNLRSASTTLEEASTPHRWNGEKAPTPLRTRIRAIAIPTLTDAVGHDVVPALARTADMLRDDADALDSYAADLYEQVHLSEQARLSLSALDIGKLAAAPKAARTRALRLALRNLGIPSDVATRATVLALDALVTNWHGQGGVNLPGGIVARRIGGILRFDLSQPAPDPAQSA